MSDLDAFTGWRQIQNFDKKSIAAYRRAVVAFSTWYRWKTGREFSPEALDGGVLYRWASDLAHYGLRGRRQERPALATRNKLSGSGYSAGAPEGPGMCPRTSVGT